VRATPSLELDQLNMPILYVINAFFPFFWPFTPDALRALGAWGAQLAATPFGLLPANQLALLIGQANPLLVLFVLALPILACWSIVRDSVRTAQYAAIFIGVLLFAQLWQFPGSPRHHGILFMALVGTVWMWRSAILPARPLAVVWIALLAINALGGLTTLASEGRPFSQGRDVAAWLQRQHLDGAFLIATRDYAGSTVSGYLRRPLYYPECECFGTYIVWNRKREHSLAMEEIVARLDRVMKAENKDEAYLIYSYPDQLDGQRILSELVFELLQHFPNAIMGDETYVVYRVTRKAE